MRIAICDDCREDANALRTCLEEHRVEIFSGPQALLDDLDQNADCYDLYLLDIYMDDALNGIQLARQLRSRDEDADICFISSSDEFYRDAYDIQDVNYLLKPVQADTLRQLVERVRRRRKKRHHQFFTYKRKGQTESLPYGNILFFNSHGHVLDIYCKDGSILPCSAKLDDIEAVLDGGTFLRCHQSYLVNLYQIDHLSGNDLLISGHRVAISRRYFADVKRRYQEILFEEVT